MGGALRERVSGAETQEARGGGALRGRKPVGLRARLPLRGTSCHWAERLRVRA